MFRASQSKPIRIGNLTILRLQAHKIFFDYHGRQMQFSGTLDLEKKRFRLLSLFVYSFFCAFFIFILFARQDLAPPIAEEFPESAISENTAEDREAKKGESKYLEETEAQKQAILEGKIISSEESQASRIKFKLIQYRVRKKETLADLSLRFKVPIESIAGSSGISPESSLYSGQVLSIPNKPGLVYKLKRGETLAKVTDFYKAKIEEVILENELSDSDFLKPGEVVFIPGAILPDPLPVWRIPVGSRMVTSNWGTRTFPQYKFHAALDLRANYEPVYPARKGKVVYAGWMGGYGNAVVIRHDESFQTVYAHNSKLYVRPGDFVSVNKPISRSGCTGYCFGPHLHFEMIKDGKFINPAKVIKGFVFK